MSSLLSFLPWCSDDVVTWLLHSRRAFIPLDSRHISYSVPGPYTISRTPSRRVYILILPTLRPVFGARSLACLLSLHSYQIIIIY